MIIDIRICLCQDTLAVEQYPGDGSSCPLCIRGAAQPIYGDDKLGEKMEHVEVEVDPFKEAAAIDPVMRFFGYSHLPPHLQPLSRPFGELALWMFNELPRNAERTVAIRKLLEAKDAAVRAGLPG